MSSPRPRSLSAFHVAAGFAATAAVACASPASPSDPASSRAGDDFTAAAPPAVPEGYVEATCASPDDLCLERIVANLGGHDLPWLHRVENEAGTGPEVRVVPLENVSITPLCREIWVDADYQLICETASGPFLTLADLAQPFETDYAGWITFDYAKYARARLYKSADESPDGPRYYVDVR